MHEQHPLPIEAQQHLEQITHDPTRERVAEHIQGLHLVGNLQEQQPAPAEFTPEFAPENDMVAARMTSIAEQGAMAHSELAEAGHGQEGEISPTQIWDKVLENQLSSAAQAKEAGDTETAVDTLVDYLITTELTQASPDLSGTVDTQQKKVEGVLNATVAEGLSTELVEAARRSYGLVRVEPARNNAWSMDSSAAEGEVDVTSIAHTIEKVKPQVEVVTGRAVSVDPEDSPQGEDLMPEAIEERIGGLSLESSVATAQGVAKTDEQEGAQRPEVVDQLTIQALEKLPADPFARIDRAEQLARLNEANPSLSDPSKYEEQFRAIRDMRGVHTHYRINRDEIMPLDKTMVDLWEKGLKDLAGRILTAGNEIAEENGHPGGAIGHLVGHRPELMREIQDEVQRRQETCKQQLESSLIPPDVAEDKLAEVTSNAELIVQKAMATQDPERTTEIVRAWSEDGANSAEEILSTIERLDGNPDSAANFNLLIILTEREKPITDLSQIQRVLDITTELSSILNSPNIASRNHEFFDDNQAGSELRSQFEQVIQHPLMSILRPGGILHSKADAILGDVLEHGDRVGLCDNIYESFSQPQPLWKSLVRFTELMVGVQVDSLGEGQDHPVKVIPKPELNSDNSTDSASLADIERFVPEHFSEMTAEQRRSLAEDSLEGMSDDQVASLDALTFDRFTADAKKNIFAFQLEQTVEMSRDSSAKEQAGLRNEHMTSEGIPVVQEGDFIHGTDLRALTSILQDGNVAGEARKDDSRQDSYPYNVDFSTIGGSETIQGKIQATISYNGYANGENGIMLVYRRDSDSWMAGQETEAKEGHALIFGGIPSTEISGLVLKTPSSSLYSASRAVVENGFYIPIYDEEGTVLFSSEQYKQMQEDLNMEVDIPAENIIDSSLKAEDQKGVSEGGLYLFPTEEGPVKYYVKFAENPDHIWTEYAADELYRAAGVAVPDSRVVMVEGRLGRASRWVEEGADLPASESSTLEDGAAMDMLLANWDVVYNSANTMEVDGKILRPDSGSALDMWATGVYKKDGTWGEEVHELDQGTDKQKLWEGMRQEYSELTDEKLKQQVETVRERLTDEVIDGIIDSIRRPREARDSLKQILKARRNYMIQKVLGAPPPVESTEAERYF